MGSSRSPSRCSSWTFRSLTSRMARQTVRCSRPSVPHGPRCLPSVSASPHSSSCGSTTTVSFTSLRLWTEGTLPNGLLLLLVTFVPFPTAVLARYIDQEAAHVAAALSCGTYVCICLAYNILVYVASGRWLLRAHISERDIPHPSRLPHGVPIYLVAPLVALLSPFAGIAMCSSLWLLWARLNYGPPKEWGHPRTPPTEALNGWRPYAHDGWHDSRSLTLGSFLVPGPP